MQYQQLTTSKTFMNEVVTQKLGTGSISVSVEESVFPVNELFDFAERINPKRSFLFVSKVLGKHIPVKPSVMRNIYRQLAQKMPAINHETLFIGMAETAVGLASGVYQEAAEKVPNSVLLTSTRYPLPAKLLCEFKENHSHATDHLIYWPANETQRLRVKSAKTLVLIDDEATTGNTFKNLAKALFNEGLTQIEHIYTVTITDWSNTALAEVMSLPVCAISIASGQWQWQPNPQASLPKMPDVGASVMGAYSVSNRQDWGRLGFTANELNFGQNIKPDYAGQKILVLGTGEFLFQPFLLAERLENLGAEVVFSSTTRSPIAEGLAIKSALVFDDNYGIGMPNFAYNIADKKFERVIVCAETEKQSMAYFLEKLLATCADKVEFITYE